jgi:hypothetical protein
MSPKKYRSISQFVIHGFRISYICIVISLLTCYLTTVGINLFWHKGPQIDFSFISVGLLFVTVAILFILGLITPILVIFYAIFRFYFEHQSSSLSFFPGYTFESLTIVLISLILMIGIAVVSTRLSERWYGLPIFVLLNILYFILSGYCLAIITGGA